jgi:UDP-N-acetylglucosamine pyrophosphorylase
MKIPGLSLIQPLDEGAIIPYNDLSFSWDDLKISNLLSKLVVVKLNGGLGTSMG